MYKFTLQTRDWRAECLLAHQLGHLKEAASNILLNLERFLLEGFCLKFNACDVGLSPRVAAHERTQTLWSLQELYESSGGNHG